jgi:acyl-CoA synthetase (AMP-forming)/AMP-acid ligase II
VFRTHADCFASSYDKRRTILLSQYLDQPAVQVEAPDDASSQADGRTASLAALSGGRPPSTVYQTPASTMTRSPSGDFGPQRPPSQVGRFQERQLAVRNPSNRQSSYSSFSSYTQVDRPQSPESYAHSRSGTFVNSDWAFNPNDPGQFEQSAGRVNRRSTTLDSQQAYFSDFAGPQGQEHRESYGGPHRYSAGDAFSPTIGVPPPLHEVSTHGFVEPMAPLEPRDVPFAVYDPHNGNIPMSRFDNIAAVLRHRAKMNAKQSAFWVLDAKGKEMASITWEKLGSRSEKVAQVIREKSNLYRGDRVALVYRETEMIDFVVALMGCFIAGVVAVPMNHVNDYQKLSLLLTTTQAHLALTTENNLKAFHRDISAQRLKWPTGVEWWKTNEFGSWHPKKKDEAPPLQVPDLAYIEFCRAPTGDLRGVVLSHRTIMHQMACLSSILTSVPQGNSTDTFNPNLRDNRGSLVAPSHRPHGETILSYLDPREGVGLIWSVLFGIYGGHTTVWMEPKTVETPGLYAHLISKYRTTLMVADYPGLKRVAYNYQQDPMATRNYKKNTEPNFATVKLCLIDTLTIDCEFHEILADRWLKPMRNPRARELVAPILALPEHGGMIVSMRDWLGGEERMGCPLSIQSEDDGKQDSSPDVAPPSGGFSSLIGGATSKRSEETQSRTALSEALLDKESLKTNEVVVLAMGEEARRRQGEPGTIRVGAFGYPLPDATLAIVDPETSLLCSPYTVGEIWVDSPSLSGGFWALPKHTENIFHARPFHFNAGNPTPTRSEYEFLRTGLLGCIIEGKVFVLGLYEDRIRQRVEWVEDGIPEVEYRFFFVQHLVVTIMKTVPRIYDW